MFMRPHSKLVFDVTNEIGDTIWHGKIKINYFRLNNQCSAEKRNEKQILLHGVYIQVHKLTSFRSAPISRCHF